MATFDTVADELILDIPNRGETIDVAIAGTYVMVILLQVEIGSRGSGAWQTIQTFNTEDETVAITHTSKNFNERIRLFLDTDTSGSATVTLTDNDNRVVHTLVDQVGNKLAEWTQAGLKLFGSVSRDGGVVTVTTSTVTLTPEDHAGKVVSLNLAAGIAVTLPAATGSGNVYKLLVGITFTSAATIKAASAADSFIGTAVLFADAGDTVVGFAVTAADDTIDLLGTANSTGGIAGEMITITDIAAGLFAVELVSDAGGTEATPFSATVS